MSMGKFCAVGITAVSDWSIVDMPAISSELCTCNLWLPLPLGQSPGYNRRRSQQGSTWVVSVVFWCSGVPNCFSHICQITIWIIWMILSCHRDMLSRICTVQIHPRNRALDHADCTAYTRHELDHTWYRSGLYAGIGDLSGV